MIYWDYNAGTPLLPQVRMLLASTFTEHQANPSSIHQLGRYTRKRLEGAREAIAHCLEAQAQEVLFTSSGSEAAALAIIGAFRARKAIQRKRIVTTAIEHPCVLGAISQLEQEGAQVIRVPPTADGVVLASHIKAAMNASTALCSVQWVNNEIGSIQPIAEVAHSCADLGVIYHCDAAQALGRLPLTWQDVPIDLLSFSAHKLGGPPGIGALLCRAGTPLAALVPGHQEDGRRGGTPCTALAEAMALALEHTIRLSPTVTTQVRALRDRFEREALLRLPGSVVHGAHAQRVANTSNLRFQGLDGEALLIALDLKGIYISTGAACMSGALSPSHVLQAIGLTPAETQASLRFSLGEGSTNDEVTQVLDTLTHAVRAMQELK